MIIVEVKSKKRCCRGDVRPLNEDMLDSFINSNIGKSIRTYAQKKVAEVLVSYLFGELTPEAKASITYKTIMEAIAQVDLKDLIGVVRGENSACRTVAENVMVAIMKVVNAEISDELAAFAANTAGNLSGGPNPIFNTITSALAGTERMIVAVAAEGVKEMEELDAFADALCEMEWLDMLKKEFAKVPGIGFIMDKIFGA